MSLMCVDIGIGSYFCDNLPYFALDLALAAGIVIFIAIIINLMSEEE